jgi:hypothetical protein
MAEWSKAAALKAVEGHTSQGSNPCLSAMYLKQNNLLNLSTFNNFHSKIIFAIILKKVTFYAYKRKNQKIIITKNY